MKLEVNMKRVSKSSIAQKEIEKQKRKERREYAKSITSNNDFVFKPKEPPRGNKSDVINRINPMDVPELNLNKTYLSTLDEDMKEREQIAKIKADKLKKQVAPLYSKGAYQLITSVDILHDIGKKK
jgi:sortase (surface protein transpeptidase)